MKNIVVLGDVRIHLFEGDRDLPGQTKAFGGAILMEHAIHRALQLRFDRDDLPNVLSYGHEDEDEDTDVPFEENPGSHESGCYRWDVKLTAVRSTGYRRYCLLNRTCCGRTYLPLPSKDLADFLSTDQNFGNSTSRLDMVVIDDLGLQIGNLSFDSSSINATNFGTSFRRAKKAREKAQKKISAIEQELNKLDLDGDVSRESFEEIQDELQSARQAFDDACKQPIKLTLHRLYSRLKETSDQVGASGTEYPAEPVILLSVTDKIPELVTTNQVLDADSLFSKTPRGKQTLLQHIYQDEPLRKRTVILLDATTLRKEIAISAGLSWERTAQDTIAEFKRNNKLRAFLNFGNVLIRFGLTGCLLISNEGNGKFSYSLYFNPNEDDTVGTHKDEGVVLGETSILAATIVEQLEQVCRYRGGAPILQDIRHALDRSLLLGVSRLLNHFEVGYGTGRSAYQSRLANMSSDSFRDRVQILRQEIGDKTRSKSDSILSSVLVQKVPLSPTRSQYWSILSQSCQADMNDAARTIVLHGPKLALNTMEECLEVFVEAWLARVYDQQSPQNDMESELSEKQKKLLFDRLFRDFQQKLFELAEMNSKRIRQAIGVQAHNGLEQILKAFTEIKGKEGFIDLLSRCYKKVINPGSQDIGERFRRELHSELIHVCRQLEPVQRWSDSISSPVLWLGTQLVPGEPDSRLLVIDRKEVEGIRAVKRMIEQYLRGILTGESTRPLSIAVFGPPGAGKSVVVKKIIEMMEGAKTKVRTLNLSKMSGFDAFDRNLQEIVNDFAKEKDVVPVVFFDEFDAALGEKPYGWLKSFLSIMEDGEPFRDAVYIFAGGTANTFESFSMSDYSRSDERWVEFSSQKGPDFVSRLSGHINVVGVNQAGPDDNLYLIRRALVLRFLISQIQGLGDRGRATVDENMLNAFLHVPNYIHGSRSMRMLVDLCVQRDHRCIAMSELPPIHQLNMQVDGKAFAAYASGQIRPVLTDISDS